MGRKDPSFSSADIVRVWCNNLTPKEQSWTFIFFFTVVPGILLTDEELDFIFTVIKEGAPTVGAKLLIEIISFAMKPLRKILNTVWAGLIFDGPLEKEVLRCIFKRLDRP